MRTAIRSKLSFANVTSCLALFIALGGTELRRRHAAAQQRRLRAAALEVGRLVRAEVQRRHLPRRSRTARSARATCRPTARASLRGRPVLRARPARPGTTFRAAVPSGGTVAAGNATRATHDGRDERVRRRVSPRPGRLHRDRDARRGAVRPDARAARGRADHGLVVGATVVVKTYRADGTAAEQPFNVIVAC